MPVQLVKAMVGSSTYENQVETMKRAAAWVNATGVVFPT